jgi:hypothetical protein
VDTSDAQPASVSPPLVRANTHLYALIRVSHLDRHTMEYVHVDCYYTSCNCGLQGHDYRDEWPFTATLICETSGLSVRHHNYFYKLFNSLFLTIFAPIATQFLFHLLPSISN